MMFVSCPCQFLSVSRSVFSLVGWLAGLLVGWSVGQSVSLSVGLSVGCSVCPSPPLFEHAASSLEQMLCYLLVDY